MFKNVASQKLTVLVIDTVNNVPKTGDAANITCYRSIDDGTVTVLGDTSATEIDATNAPGLYVFDLTQAETNGNKILFSGKSSTTGIRVVPLLVYTVPPNFSSLVIDSSGLADANTVKVGPSGSGTAQTARDLGNALPSAAPNANGGLPVLSSAGTTLAYTVTTLTTYTGNTPQTGDAYARIGATGSGLTSLAPASTALSTATWTGTRAGYLDNLSGGAVALASTALTASGVRSAIGMASANLDTQIAALPTANGTRDAIFAKVVGNGTLTFENYMVVIGAEAGGESSGMAAGTPIFNELGTSSAVITATLDSDNNRTAVTLTP